MRYIYIAGQEHSGTTLTNQLLSSGSGYLGLGELQQFLSPDFVQGYLSRWGNYPDARICSCGKDWGNCAFWGPLHAATGQVAGTEPLERMQKVLNAVRNQYGENATVVDASKSLNYLRFLWRHRDHLGFAREDFLVLFTVRDVRGFVSSMLRKADGQRSLRHVIGLMRLWHHSTRTLQNFLHEEEIPHVTNFYEQLCHDGGTGIASAIEAAGFDPPGGSVAHSDSHITLGNKNFLSRNRGEIRYDMSWFSEDLVNLCYLLYWPARRYNRQFYRAR